MTSGDPLGSEGRAVEGGLDEPTGLEPEQGSLALADPADHYDRSAWEVAAAAVLRKARRLSEDDADEAVWAKLTRTTLDGIEVPPLGQPADLDGLTTSGRPTRTSAWDVRVRADGDATRSLAELETGATSLWLDADGVDLDAALEGVVAAHRAEHRGGEVLVRLGGHDGKSVTDDLSSQWSGFIPISSSPIHKPVGPGLRCRAPV